MYIDKYVLADVKMLERYVSAEIDRELTQNIVYYVRLTISILFTLNSVRCKILNGDS